MIAGSSFQGTELIGIAVGESEDPARNIPGAVRQVFCALNSPAISGPKRSVGLPVAGAPG
ncbi:hypothetical protein AWV80_03285 [Cupriavidus sp. UYMU48A]|nr:hypothetical protein AWV80_03285 [Cupriavidus sp. UYMU48A]